MPDLTLDRMSAPRLIVKRLSSGYWHIRGTGSCNWGQFPAWPIGVDDPGFFAQAGDAFRAEVIALPHLEPV